ncbi:unnamed protein product [Prorocentrum cordatum]|uniref:Uncharacterized protein n=1 Tax=Prorocentrum cordatum TaxID=2364126 RepID=A0ABN9US15_9DINO|nr:unnamed protein product [Polarella glacialis]
MKCIKCNNPATPANAAPTGSKTVSSVEHYACRGANRAMKARIKDNKHLKTWWDNLKGDDLTDWYDRQYKKAQPGRGHRREWDDTQFTQWQERSTGSENRNRTHWQPFDEYETFWFIRGKDPKQIVKDWLKECEDPSKGAKKENGEWLLPKFIGVIEDAVNTNMTHSSVSRTVKATDVEMAREVQEEMDAEHDAVNRRVLLTMASRVGTGASTDRAMSMQPEEHNVQTPAAMSMAPSLPNEILRDMKRKLAAEQELDEELAAIVQQEADRTAQEKREGGGKRQKSLDVVKLNALQTSSSYATKLKGDGDTMGSKKDDLVKGLDTVMQALLAGSDASDGEGGAAATSDLKGRSDLLKTNLDAVVLAYKTNVQDFIEKKLPRSNITNCTDFEQVDGVLSTMKADVANWKKNEQSIQNFKDAHGQGMKLIKEAQKALGKATHNVGAPGLGGDGDAIKSPGIKNLIIMQQTMAAHFDHGAMDLSEIGTFWEDQKVFHFTSRAECDLREKAKSLAADDYFGKSAKWLTKHMKENELLGAKAAIMKVVYERSVNSIMSECFPAAVLEKVNLIFETQLFRYLCGWNICTPGAFGCGELMWVFAGEAVVAGVPESQCPGSTLKDKVNFLQAATKEDWNLVTSRPGGFRVKLQAPNAIAFPPGVIVTVAVLSTTFEGARRGILNQVAAHSAFAMLDQMRTTFDGADDEAHKSWARYLKAGL